MEEKTTLTFDEMSLDFTVNLHHTTNTPQYHAQGH
jgi:hypothetical protein